MRTSAKQYARSAVSALAEGAAVEEVASSLQEVMIARRDMHLLKTVSNQLAQADAVRQGKLLAVIRTNAVLTNEETAQIKKYLTDYYHKPIETTIVIDPEVIGIIIDINQEQLAYTTAQIVAAVAQSLVNEEN